MKMHPESYRDRVIQGGHVGILPAEISGTDCQLFYENSGERSVEAQGLLIQIDLMFFGKPAVFKKILGDVKCVSDMLQAPSLDLA